MEIYVAYAEANGHATEALSNVRTVKAMSTEAQGVYVCVCVSVLNYTQPHDPALPYGILEATGTRFRPPNYGEGCMYLVGVFYNEHV